MDCHVSLLRHGPGQPLKLTVDLAPEVIDVRPVFSALLPRYCSQILRIMQTLSSPTPRHARPHAVWHQRRMLHSQLN